jgi:hypothetical protein
LIASRAAYIRSSETSKPKPTNIPNSSACEIRLKTPAASTRSTAAHIALAASSMNGADSAADHRVATSGSSTRSHTANIAVLPSMAIVTAAVAPRAAPATSTCG